MVKKKLFGQIHQMAIRPWILDVDLYDSLILRKLNSSKRSAALSNVRRPYQAFDLQETYVIFFLAHRKNRSFHIAKFFVIEICRVTQHPHQKWNSIECNAIEIELNFGQIKVYRGSSVQCTCYATGQLFVITKMNIRIVKKERASECGHVNMNKFNRTNLASKGESRRK